MSEVNNDSYINRSTDHVDAINAIFILIEDAYPSVFHRYIRTTDDYIRIKRVWKKSLEVYPPRIILLAAKDYVTTVEAFPCLASIHNRCESIIRYGRNNQ